MSYEITDLYFYDDLGYTEQSAYVPSHGVVRKSGSFDTDDFESVKLRDGDGERLYHSGVPLKVPTSDMFRRFTLRGTYSQYMNASYCEFVVHWNNASGRFTDTEHSQHFYAWIDSVELKSDTEGNPATVFNYHVDLWKTYIDKIDIRYGHILNRPKSDNDPIQNCSYIYRRPNDTEYNLFRSEFAGFDCWWAVINYADESEDNQTVKSRIITVPVSRNTSQSYYFKLTEESEKLRCPTLEDWVLGKYDEIFGISPASIASAYLSPVPPFLIGSGTGDVDDPFILSVATTTPEPVPSGWKDLPNVQKWITGVSTHVIRASGDQYSQIIKYSDGSTARSDQSPSTAGVRGGYSVITYDMMAIGNRIYVSVNGTRRNTDEGAFVISIDDYARSILGDDGFNKLADGDTFEIKGSNIVNVYENMSTEWVWGGRDDWYCEFKITVSNPIETRIWSYNANTHSFGNANVLSYTLPDQIQYQITTTTMVITSAEYGAEKSDKTGYTDYGYIYSKTGRCYEYSASLEDTLTTDDTHEYYISDMDGNIAGAIPWGLKVKDYTFRVVNTSTSGAISIRFDGLDSSIEGLETVIPLQSLDIASNSWSDYVFSQREYDITQKKIANQQALVSGISNTLTGGVSNAIMGGIGGPSRNMLEDYASKLKSNFIQEAVNQKGLRKDAVGPAFNALGRATEMTQLPTSVGVRGGFGATAGMGVATAGIEYAINEVFNAKLQKATDVMQAKQIDSIIVSGSIDYLFHGRPVKLKCLMPDEYSVSRFEADIRLNGVSVSEPTEDIELTEGPWRISEAVITGKVPVEAKTYIAMRLNTGVRIFTEEYYGQ